MTQDEFDQLRPGDTITWQSPDHIAPDIGEIAEVYSQPARIKIQFRHYGYVIFYRNSYIRFLRRVTPTQAEPDHKGMIKNPIDGQYRFL